MMLTTLLVLAAATVVLLVLLLVRTGNSADASRLAGRVAERLNETDALIEHVSAGVRADTMARLRENREELSNTLAAISRLMSQEASEMSGVQARFLSELMEQLGILRTQLEESARNTRGELAGQYKSFEDRIAADTAALAELYRTQFAQMRAEQDRAQRTQAETIDAMRAENAARLEQMRASVDEQLHKTIEQRFDASFRAVSDQLEHVHRGLGEMRQLAAGVGDLRRILTNVKTRGTFGEIQLGAILDQFLSPEQYVRDAHVEPGSPNHVEYAVRLPGRTADETILLPVDSKFPVEAYQRLLEAYDAPDGAAAAAKEGALFEREIRRCAQEISTKYIRTPHTTDFAIMFVPSEGIYAEVLRRPGLTDMLQRTFRVAVVGPSNLVAFLSSLQMGFRTLAIEKHTSEAWELLGEVRTQFGQFADALDKTRRKLEEATRAVDNAGVRSRAIERRLRRVESLPDTDPAMDDA